MSPPVAIVTGASSGIGLALSKRLLEGKWKVVMADINPPSEQLDNILFLRCDVSSWEDQAALFKQAYDWQGRLDFAALNAGIDDRDDIFNSISFDPSKPPTKPNMLTVDVDFVGVYYGIKLAAHYMSLDSKAAGKPQPGGKIIATASAAGIYTNPLIPQYAGAKHAVVGLVRALAPAAIKANIRINGVCPSFVQTNIVPQNLLDAIKGDPFTPMSTIMSAFSELGDFDNVSSENWVENGKNGATVEGNMQGLLYHEAPKRPGASAYANDEGVKIWQSIYTERNKNFASSKSN